MSAPYQYWGRGSHMSADLKRTIHAVRSKSPHLFAQVTVRESSMDGEGRVVIAERKDVRAQPLSGERRHRLSFQKDRY